ncbi:nitrate reductase, beta subunit [Aeropyrum pernix]|uniref:Nitrate reductase, beta subunit n=2 Tax=Aeropyrum pernix TaxID=56636 RepID=A0A401H9N9_AERPX|nr:nitrate reductase, beta subunit [Aeropyrum pernix]
MDMVRAQISMVMVLDKCIGCHTCSLTCKNVWTNREGLEYAWWNNVETRPGVGYPKTWENQEKYGGGWVLRNGKLRLRLETGRFKTPGREDYYEPFTYDYENLFSEELSDQQPHADPISMYSGEKIDVQWGPNFDDDLAGGDLTIPADPNWSGIDKAIYKEFKNVFMFYLPRICNHCLNPSCLAACPRKSVYKRPEDGIVLIDQTRCRGYRQCVQACPYKKVYYNWKTGKSEKCIFCFPRIETGQPPVCALTCVGKIRYVGVVLYDEERVLEAAKAPEDQLVALQRDIILDPFDPQVVKAARESGVPDNFIEAARKSPIYYMFKKWEIALPLHPEFRTLPMVFYVPPLNPVVTVLDRNGKYSADYDSILPTIDKLRIPIRYLANMFAAGNEEEVRKALKRLLAIREFFRQIEVEGKSRSEAAWVLEENGLTVEDADMMFRWLALGRDRYVIPTAKKELRIRLPSKGR